ncbi:MAG: endolytic transglycosylase MltG [Patescibacteria group bacterium]
MRHHLKLIFIIIVLFVIGESIHVSSYNKDIRKLILMSIDNLSHPEFYQALANPTVSYINIPEGLRKEQVAEIAQDRFNWGTSSTEDFLGYDEMRSSKFEGKYYPGIYLVARNISGHDLKNTMNSRFENEYSSIEASLATSTLTTDQILTIASIIEREAAGKSDMALISGIIENRLKRGMNLQMDATLQYAKGTTDNGWWPIVLSRDKKIESPYNTYKYNGLPPSPIANPGEDAIVAALNPAKTNCVYYFHKNDVIYCSATYAEHKRKIDLYLK